MIVAYIDNLALAPPNSDFRLGGQTTCNGAPKAQFDKTQIKPPSEDSSVSAQGVVSLRLLGGKSGTKDVSYDASYFQIAY